MSQPEWAHNKRRDTWSLTLPAYEITVFEWAAAKRMEPDKPAWAMTLRFSVGGVEQVGPTLLNSAADAEAAKHAAAARALGRARGEVCKVKDSIKQLEHVLGLGGAS